MHPHVDWLMNATCSAGVLLVFAGDTCLAPVVKSQTYSTPEAVVSTDTVLIAEFTLTCKNNLKVLVYFKTYLWVSYLYSHMLLWLFLGSCL